MPTRWSRVRSGFLDRRGLGVVWGVVLGVLGVLKIEFCESDVENDEFEVGFCKFDEVEVDKKEDEGVLRRSITVMRARCGVEGSAVVGVVVAIAPQLQWVVMHYSGKFQWI